MYGNAADKTADFFLVFNDKMMRFHQHDRSFLCRFCLSRCLISGQQISSLSSCQQLGLTLLLR